MANFGRSFKTSSFLSPRARRSGMPRRTLSSSSSDSLESSSSRHDDPFMFSASNTPTQENAPLVRGGGNNNPTGGVGGATAATSAGAAANNRSLVDGGVLQDQAASSSNSNNNNNKPGTDSSESSAELSRSKPIAIEFPQAIRKTNTAPVYTPPEPLSARGDIPGGYFPLHEDPKSRVHRPHPFHVDEKKARHRSISQAAESVKTQPGFLDPGATTANMPDRLQVPQLNVVSSTNSSSHMPVSSYLPSGVTDNALPMGKYYPSNYEKRIANSNKNHSNTDSSGSSSSRKQRATARAPAAAVPPHSRSEPQVPKHRNDSNTPQSHNRSESDVKRRLQQYQRDMIAQATLAASAVIESSARQQQGSSSSSGTSLPAGAASLRNIQLGGSIIRSSKPISPQLLPLGSPGPVTPMNLEAEGVAEGYMSIGQAVQGPDAMRHTEEVARAILAEDERRRREDGGSPVVQPGPV